MNRVKLGLVCLVGLFVIVGFGSLRMILLGQSDNFDTDLENWATGGVNPNPPVLATDGGPSGAGDSFMRVISSGAVGPGGKLVVFNTVQWTGDYTTAGVGSISMDLENRGSEPIELYIRLEAAGGNNFRSTTGLTLASGSGWTNATFALDATNLTGGTNLATALAGVTRFRIFHSAGGTWPPDDFEGEFGVDNVTAEGILPVELVSFTGHVSDSRIALTWLTISEVRNAGFEIQEMVIDPTSDSPQYFDKVGFAAAKGGSARTEYSFDLHRPVGVYRYRLKQLDTDGSFAYSPEIEIAVEPKSVELSQVYPNPTKGTSTIEVTADRTIAVRISVFDALGREVSVVHDGLLDTANAFEIQSDKLSAGMYFVKAFGEGFVSTRKFAVIK